MEEVPFYKKAWFWVVIALVTAAAIGGSIFFTGILAKKAVDTAGNAISEASDALSKLSSGEKTEYNNYRLGEVVTKNGMEYTITSVERSYSTGNEFITPGKGKEFVKVNTSLKNVSKDKQSYNVIYWTAETGSGDITSFAIMAQADDALSSGELISGGSKNASVVFEVPAGSSIKLHIQTNPFNSNDEIVIAL